MCLNPIQPLEGQSASATTFSHTDTDMKKIKGRKKETGKRKTMDMETGETRQWRSLTVQNYGHWKDGT